RACTRRTARAPVPLSWSRVRTSSQRTQQSAGRQGTACGEDSMVLTDIRYHEQGWQVAWQLLQERPPEANISHAGGVTVEAHRAFVQSYPYRNWFVIDSDPVKDEQGVATTVPVGCVYVTKQNWIGIAILKGWKRLGYAERAIQNVIDFLPPLPAIPSERQGYYVAHV